MWNAVGVCEGSGHTKGDGCTVPRVGTLRILEGLTLLRGLVQPQVYGQFGPVRRTLSGAGKFSRHAALCLNPTNIARWLTNASGRHERLRPRKNA